MAVFKSSTNIIKSHYSYDDKHEIIYSTSLWCYLVLYQSLKWLPTLRKEYITRAPTKLS